MSTNTLKLFKQRLIRIHVACGITVSLFMYISLFFGIIAIFKPYIDNWEKPSRHFELIELSKIDYSSMIDPIVSRQNFANSHIEIYLPGGYGSTLDITHKSINDIVLDPRTGQLLDEDDRNNSNLGRFLNQMHYGRPLGELFEGIFALVAVGCMVLLIGGLIMVSILKYKDDVNNKLGKFSKWHRKIFIYLFPVFFLISLTGAIMNSDSVYGDSLAFIASHGESSSSGEILFPDHENIKSQDVESVMLPMNELIEKARIINPDLIFQRLELMNWRDTSAQISISGYNPYRPFLNGLANEPTVTLSGVDGSLIKNMTVIDAGWELLTREAFYYVHRLFEQGIYFRIVIALLMLACTAAVGFGVMLWLEKKAQKYRNKTPFYHWMGKLALSAMIGVIPATGLIFNLQWIISFDVLNRVVWVEGIFYLAWLATLTWSFYRICSYKAMKEFLMIGAFLFLLAPFNHWIFSGFSPFRLYELNMIPILLVDITLIIVGICFILAGKKVPSSRSESKIFWKNKF